MVAGKTSPSPCAHAERPRAPAGLFVRSACRAERMTPQKQLGGASHAPGSAWDAAGCTAAGERCRKAAARAGQRRIQPASLDRDMRLNPHRIVRGQPSKASDGVGAGQHQHRSIARCRRRRCHRARRCRPAEAAVAAAEAALFAAGPPPNRRPVLLRLCHRAAAAGGAGRGAAQGSAGWHGRGWGCAGASNCNDSWGKQQEREKAQVQPTWLHPALHPPAVLPATPGAAHSPSGCTGARQAPGRAGQFSSRPGRRVPSSGVTSGGDTSAALQQAGGLPPIGRRQTRAGPHLASSSTASMHTQSSRVIGSDSQLGLEMRNAAMTACSDEAPGGGGGGTCSLHASAALQQRLRPNRSSHFSCTATANCPAPAPAALTHQPEHHQAGARPAQDQRGGGAANASASACARLGAV